MKEDREQMGLGSTLHVLGLLYAMRGKSVNVAAEPGPRQAYPIALRQRTQSPHANNEAYSIAFRLSLGDIVVQKAIKRAQKAKTNPKDAQRASKGSQNGSRNEPSGANWHQRPPK